MKGHKKRIRVLRALAIAGSVTAVALPSAAVASPLAGDPPTAVRHENAPAYKSDPWAGGLSQPTVKKPYVLPSSHKTDAQSASPGKAAPSSSVIRELRTVTGNDGRTLAIALASAALGIALCGTGYAMARVARIQRRVLGSSS